MGDEHQGHACAVHTDDVVRSLGSLAPLADDPSEPVRPDELLEWVSVEYDDRPDVAGHPWRVELADEVGLLVDPDRDDVADALGSQRGVHSVVQLDREVLVVDAPSLCSDGLRAAVMRAVGAAHEVGRRASADSGTSRAVSEPGGVTRPDVPGSAAATSDELAARLVTGDARSGHRRVQVWVNQDGILVLPAQTIPHGPLDPGDNPHFHKATYDTGAAAVLAHEHSGRWVPYGEIDVLDLRRPGPLRRRWSVTVHPKSGGTVSFAWQGTRAHALLLWAYVVAKCGLERVHGAP